MKEQWGGGHWWIKLLNYSGQEKPLEGQAAFRMR